MTLQNWGLVLLVERDVSYEELLSRRVSEVLVKEIGLRSNRGRPELEWEFPFATFNLGEAVTSNLGQNVWQINRVGFITVLLGEVPEEAQDRLDYDEDYWHWLRIFRRYFNTNTHLEINGTPFPHLVEFGFFGDTGVQMIGYDNLNLVAFLCEFDVVYIEGTEEQ